MQYSNFIELLNKGETKSVDFKIKCNAFIKGHEKDTAELVKDIIALSNNGNISSYLIIGVSDDKTGFLSVDNDKLTDDNLQSLCKDTIFPIPRIKLERCIWKDTTDAKHKDKEFAIIQIGRQARQCFRFNKDYIDYDQKYCFRKHEVWIRRGATSDLASPEEIQRLLEGKDPILDISSENNWDYTRISFKEAKKKIIEDLGSLLESVNGKIIEYKSNRSYIQTYYSISINIDTIHLRLGLFIMEKVTREELQYCESMVTYFDHGLLLFTLGNISSTISKMYSINIKENWGRFCFHNKGYIYNSDYHTILKEISNGSSCEHRLLCIIIDKVINTSTLNKKFSDFVNSIREKYDICNYINDSCTHIDSLLDIWKKDGCPQKTGKQIHKEYMTTYNSYEMIEQPKEGEFVDKLKYGDNVMVHNKKMVSLLDSILNSNKE